MDGKPVSDEESDSVEEIITVRPLPTPRLLTFSQHGYGDKLHDVNINSTVTSNKGDQGTPRDTTPVNITLVSRVLK